MALVGLYHPMGGAIGPHRGGSPRTRGAILPSCVFFWSHKRAKNDSEVTIFIKSWLQAVSRSPNMA